MPIVLTGQTPAPGATDHDPSAFYELVFEVTPVAADFFARVTFEGGGGPFLILDYNDPPGTIVIQAGWEATLQIVGTTVTIRFRPVGGWQAGANYGAGGGPLVGQITEVRLAGEPGLYIGAPPAFDFSTQEPPAVDVPLAGGRHIVLVASCYFTGSGVLQRRDQIASVVRESPGVYLVTPPPGRGRSLAEYDVSLTIVSTVFRGATLEGVAGGALRVRSFGPGGAPADANVALGVRPR